MAVVYKNANVNGTVTDITVENGRFVGIGKTDCEGIDLLGKTVFAGLIDVHAHGCMNIEANSGRIDELSHFEACHGTTSWLPTTATVALETIYDAVNRDISEIKGAHVLGFHAEGPYIAASRKGAQDEKYIRKPDIKEFETLPNIKMVTVAPEVPGALEFIKNCKAVVALGHTDSDYDTAVKAIENGAECLTHTFNAMPPMLHRAPGVIGAAVEKGIYAQLICDGLHVARGAVWLLYKALGADRLVLISDSVQTAGLPDGDYTSGGLPVKLHNNECRLLDGTLAGSSAFLLDCVKKAIEFGIPENDAFKMASETPAALLGVNKGKIEQGFDADFIVLDDDYTLLYTVIDGEIYYKK
ncbi:MAG: N-acetylglucosamine-6-phosphate deacetylase [Clostridiales bacterium]|nr:N-acetylglucosamine-6-phosphate deacetylase [Candidatus Equinaster intestinalis]